MKTDRTPEEKAQLVVEIFASFGKRPGEALTASDFVSIAKRRGWRTDYIADGIEHGEKLGWFDRAPGGAIRVTSAGFSQSLERY